MNNLFLNNLSTVKKLIRDSVLKIEQYQPGKPAEVLKRELDLKEEVCKLASNENPLGPSPLAVAAIQKSLREANLYPDNNCHYLKERLAKHLRILPENLRIGNGTTELILFLGMAFLNPDDALIMSQSSFIMAKIVTQIIGCKLIEVPLKEYYHDLDAILGAITDKTKIIYLDNPMNPIGTVANHREISEFMERIPEDVLIVLDEAYHDYVKHRDYPKSLGFIEEGKNVMVLRTFSKMYGLAGFRVGYCVAKNEFIHALDRVSPPFSVNRLGQIGAAAALEDKDHVRKTREINEKGKKSLYQCFKELDILYIPSETNFITFEVKNDAKWIAEELQKKGIIIRHLSMYGQPSLLRITVGTPEQNKRFIDTFRRLYKKIV